MSDYASFRAAYGSPPIATDDVVISRGRVFPDSSHPRLTDRFWIVGEAEGSGKDARRPLLPAYAAYNADVRCWPDGRLRARSDAPAADVGDAFASTRRTLWGTLRAAHWVAPEGEPSVVRHDLVAYRPDGQPVAPQQRPWCSSRDAQTASRWTGQEWQEIPCPADRCEWRQEKPTKYGKTTPCQRKLTLRLDLRWPEGPCHVCSGTGQRQGRDCAACRGTGRFAWELPPAKARLETQGPWSEATARILGFYDDIATQWAQVAAIAGVETGEPDFYGLPVRVTLQRKTYAERGSKTWVPTLSPDFPPGMTLQSWMLARVQAARDAIPLLTGTLEAPRALPGPTEAEYEVVSLERGQ